MKKTLTSLVNKMKVNQDQTISGGFGKIKGGTALYVAQNDGECTNSTRCDGTNTHTCTNSGDCHLSTNSNPGGCTNSSCFN